MATTLAAACTAPASASSSFVTTPACHSRESPKPPHRLRVKGARLPEHRRIYPGEAVAPLLPPGRVSLRRAGASAAPPVVRCNAEITRAAKKGAPPMVPVVMTPSGVTDLPSLLLRNRIIFVGQPVNAQVAQRVISQLLTLAAIDENEEIKMYINCPGGSTYSVLAIYDTMSWIKPKVSTVCFGIAASQGALLLAGGEKGRRFAMPNARIMIHQPQGGCGGTADDVRQQVNEIMQSRDKIDKMYSAFTGQPLDLVQQYTDRDRFFAASEAMEFGLIDGLLETEY